MTKPLYPKGMFVLCPACDRDALEVVEDVLALTPMRFTFFRPCPPTKIVAGEPVLSGCCEAPLLDGPEGRRRFAAMRVREGFAKP